MYLKLNDLVADIIIHLLTKTLDTYEHVLYLKCLQNLIRRLIKEARSLFKLKSEERVRYSTILPTTGLQQVRSARSLQVLKVCVCSESSV